MTGHSLLSSVAALVSARPIVCVGRTRNGAFFSSRTLARAATFLALGIVLFGCITAFGLERFPPPEFDSDYKMPFPTTPAARAQWLQYLDVGVLLAALALASWSALRKRSRRWILGVTIFSVLYFGFYRNGCICSVGSVQDVTLALFRSEYTVPWTVLAFFLLPLIFTLFFGRTFCGGVCPLGAIQDLVLVKPVKLAPWLQQGLSIVPWLWLGAGVLLAATGSMFLFCEWDPFVAFYRFGGSAFMLSLGAAFLLVGIFVGRPYCRFLCPYGALLSVFSRFSKWNVTLTPQDCVQCQLCDVACPYGAIREPVGPLPSEVQVRQKRRFIALCCLLPLLIIAGGWVGNRLSLPLSKLNGVVQLAEQVADEDAGRIAEPTDASRAFRQRSRPVTELNAEAWRVRQQFALGGWLLGAFAGLVIGAKLLASTRPLPRPSFDPDPANCVACGRCYTHCPNELIRLKREQKKKAIALTPA